MPACFALLFLASILAAALAGMLPAIVALAYAGASAAAFLAYAWDKSAARSGRWRVRERTLHAFGLAGGWPGALLAQTVLRHKTKKQPFRAILWTTVALHCTGAGAAAAFRFF